MRKRAITTMAAGVGIAATLVANPGSAHAAAQAPCDYRSYQNNSDAYLTMLGTHNLKERPAQECRNVASVAQGKGFWAWCYVISYYGNVWVYGRVRDTQTRGWMSYANLNHEDGVISHC